MKKIYFITLLIISIVSYAQTPTGSSTEVGITEGQLTVSLSGAANYSIPFAVPPGLNGVVPQIALSYSSQAGNGLAGYGWNIAGVSSITRIPSTKFHDGVIDGVDYDSLDRFALDGQRLIVKNGTNGVYGADGTIYETENYSNLKITSLGVHIDGPQYGPRYFKVEYPDGAIAMYGAAPSNNSVANYYTNNSYAIMYWQNTQGVRIDYNYIKDNNTLYIEKIEYGKRTTTYTSPSPQINKIEFSYNLRTRTEQYYTNGISTILNKILDKVSVVGDGLTIRNYYLIYNQTSLGYQRLTTITEKTDNDTKFLNPTVFAYDTTNNTNLFEAQTPVTGNFSNLSAENTSSVSGDFDGDSKIDIIIYPITGNNAKKEFHLYKNIDASNNITAQSLTTSPFLDIFASSTTSSNNKIYPYQSITTVELGIGNTVNYKTYSITNGLLTLDYTKNITLTVRRRNGCSYTNNGMLTLPQRWENAPTTFTNFKNYSGDFNGDGITDVLAIVNLTVTDVWCTDCNATQPATCVGYQNVTSAPVTRNNAYLIDLKRNATNSLLDLGQITNQITSTTKINVIDFNGDGKSDLLILNENSAKIYSLNSNNELVLLFDYTDNGIKMDKPLLIGDYNGDGKMDFCIPQQYNSAVWNFYISTGISYQKFVNSIGLMYLETKVADFGYGGYGYGCESLGEVYYIPGDINGDGKTDIMALLNYTGVQGSCSNGTPQDTIFGIAENLGFDGSTFNFNQTNIYPNINNVTRYPIITFTNHNQFNGNLDYTILYNNKIQVFKSTKNNRTDNLLKSITTGNGVVESITYKPLKNEPCGYNGCNSNYYDSSFTENYPNIDIIVAPTFNVVSQLSKQSATVFKKQSFMYYGAVSNYEGLGFLGFRGITTTNWVDASNTNLISSVTLNSIPNRGATILNYSFTGFVAPQTLPPTNNFITKTINTYNIGNTTGAFEDPLQPNKVFKLKLTKSELFNGLEQTSATTTTNYDTYNNSINSSTVLKNGATTEKTSSTVITYQNNPTLNPYIIGRPLSKEVTVTLSSNNDLSKTEEEYHYENNLLSQVKKRSTNSGLVSDYLTEDNIYDTNGNITTKTITAVGETPRITSYEYDPIYGSRFLTKSTDIEGLETTFTYNSSTGAVLTETLPSNSGYPLTTTYLYDKWSKKIKTTDYLGKSVNYIYSRDNEKTIVNTQSTVYRDISNKSEIFDDLGRKIKEGNELLNETYSYIDFEYDIYDRQTKVSEPYFGTTASLFNTTTYDGYGRVIETKDFRDKTTTISYNGLSTTIYDGIKTKTIVKNAAGNNIATTETIGGTVNYEYFANGNLKNTTYQDVATTITQDAWGRKLSLNDPSAGVYTYEYYGFGEIKKETTPKGFTDYTYTPTGKLLTKWIKDAPTPVNTNLKSTYNYNANTKLLTSIDVINPIDGNSTYTYSYDNWKRLYNTIENFTGAIPRNFVKNVTFDANGRVDLETTTATAHGKTSTKEVKYSYKMGEVYKIVDNTNQATLWQLNDINSKNQNLSSTLGTNLSLTNTYNTFGYLTQSNYTTTGTTTTNVATFTNNFHQQRANLMSRTNSLFSWNESFTYDDLDRLTSFYNKNGVATTQTYQDDGRIESNVLGTYNFTKSPKPFQNTSVTLTPAGLAYYNTLNNQTINYNAFKSPIQITQGAEKISFGYNALQDRSIMYYGNNNTDVLQRPYRKYYSGDGSVEIKYTKATTTTPEKVEFFTYIGGDAYSAPIVVRKIDNGNYENFYLLRDYQSSILAVVNQAGTVIEKRLYDAWGEILKIQDGAGNTLPKLTFFDRGYTGHEHLQSVGLIHMNARLYDPVLHRFLQPDNFVQDPSNTQNYNRYSYCVNNPLKYTDFSGNSFWKDLGNAFSDVYKAFVNVAVAVVSINIAVAIIPIVFSIGTVVGIGQFVGSGFQNSSILNNQIRIVGGLFQGNIGQIASRFTKELPQTLLGFGISLGANALGRVRRVDYYDGATVVQHYQSGWGGFTLGSFINGDSSIEADPNNRLFQHEYGHYLQSQEFGLSYINKFALPSLFDTFGDGDHRQHFAEQDANSRAFTYFNEHIENYSGWSHNPTNGNTINGYNWNLPYNNVSNQLALSNNLIQPIWYRFEF